MRGLRSRRAGCIRGASRISRPSSRNSWATRRSPADRGVRLVAPAATPRQPTDVQVSGGVRTRVRALRRMRTELAQNSVCGCCPTAGPEGWSASPSFASSCTSAPGPFTWLLSPPLLSSRSSSSHRPAPRAFASNSRALRAGPCSHATSSRSSPRLYADYVRRYPSHLPYGPSAGLFVERGENPDDEA
jgi:hypothetical protein